MLIAYTTNAAVLVITVSKLILSRVQIKNILLLRKRYTFTFFIFTSNILYIHSHSINSALKNILLLRKRNTFPPEREKDLYQIVLPSSFLHSPICTIKKNIFCSAFSPIFTDKRTCNSGFLLFLHSPISTLMFLYKENKMKVHFAENKFIIHEMKQLDSS